MDTARAELLIQSVRIGWGFSVSWISSMESDTNEKVFPPRQDFKSGGLYRLCLGDLASVVSYCNSGIAGCHSR